MMCVNKTIKLLIEKENVGGASVITQSSRAVRDETERASENDDQRSLN